MDLGALLLILAVAVLVGIFISRPFGSRRASAEPLIRPATEEIDIHRSSLLAERDRILTALQDLEFDNTLGKIPAEDYPVQRTELLKAGADILRELDEISGVAAAASAEARLEAAVAARRADAAVRRSAPARRTPAVQAAHAAQGTPAAQGARPADTAIASAPAGGRRPPASGEDDIEAMVAARRQTCQEKAGGFCPKCGRPVAKSDSFCSRCGAHL
jgi:hypothetical protein